MKHTISVLLQNKPGVLSRVTGLFSGRGFNIESLCVAETLDPNVSCLTVVSRGDDTIIEQITKQLNKLIDTIKVIDFTGQEYIERELTLIKVTAEEETRAEVLRIVDIFAGSRVATARSARDPTAERRCLLGPRHRFASVGVHGHSRRHRPGRSDRPGVLHVAEGRARAAFRRAGSVRSL